MSKKFWQTKEFKRLNEEWYLKLKASGFNDIETEKSIEQNYIIPQPKITASGLIRNNQQVEYFNSLDRIVFEREAKYEGDKYLGGLYKDDTDIVVFDCHRAGKSIRETRDLLLELKKANPKVKSLKKTTIAERLTKILNRAEVSTRMEFN
jgi:hypothetical protein